MKLPLENNAVVFGLLMLTLSLIFASASSKLKFFQKFYRFVPALLLCYFIPAIYNSTGLINAEQSEALYSIASRYLLPASLVLLCLNVDLKGLMRLGPKALVMFFAGTVGIIIGGPTALLIVSSWAPELLSGDSPDAIWRGLSTICGSWIGGGANQTAMKEIAQVPNEQFQGMVVMDVVVANIWMALLLFGAGISYAIDRRLKADNSAIEELTVRMENHQKGISRIPSFTDMIIIAGIAFGAVGASHWLTDLTAPAMETYISSGIAEAEKAGTTSSLRFVTTLGSSFFWLVVFATVFGVALSFTPLRRYEGAGASKFGSLFLYVLVATIGMHMDILQLVNDWQKFRYILLIGLIWIAIHGLIILLVAKLIRAPFFFVAVGSQANVGGAASAPVVASAFNPALAPVGVLLAVLGYAVGTFGAIIGMELMRAISL